MDDVAVFRSHQHPQMALAATQTDAAEVLGWLEANGCPAKTTKTEFLRLARGLIFLFCQPSFTCRYEGWRLSLTTFLTSSGSITAMVSSLGSPFHQGLLKWPVRRAMKSTRSINTIGSYSTKLSIKTLTLEMANSAQSSEGGRNTHFLSISTATSFSLLD